MQNAVEPPRVSALSGDRHGVSHEDRAAPPAVRAVFGRPTAARSVRNAAKCWRPAVDPFGQMQLRSHHENDPCSALPVTASMFASEAARSTLRITEPTRKHARRIKRLDITPVGNHRRMAAWAASKSVATDRLSVGMLLLLLLTTTTTTT
jgi:hypothetical protein